MLDKELKQRDGDDHAFFSQYNKVDKINHVVVCYDNETAVGCGAFKPFDSDSVEIKRMFVHPDYRGKGMAQRILNELEKWAKELHFTACVLETGYRQFEAVRLYQKSGYLKIPNYPPYEAVESSVCMQKSI